MPKDLHTGFYPGNSFIQRLIEHKPKTMGVADKATLRKRRKHGYVRKNERMDYYGIERGA